MRKLIDFDDKFDFRKALLDLGVEKSVVSDWLIVRKNKKGSNTETAFNKIKSEIEKSGINANECIKHAVVKNWVGFEASWMNGYKTTQQNTTQSGKFELIPINYEY